MSFARTNARWYPLFAAWSMWGTILSSASLIYDFSPSHGSVFPSRTFTKGYAWYTSSADLLKSILTPCLEAKPTN